jgi:hypothetical protein
LSYDPLQASGSANVPTGQSTGSQYQGADIADNLLFPQSGQVVSISAPLIFNSGVTFFTPGNISGFGVVGQAATVFQVGGTFQQSGIFPGGNSGQSFPGSGNVITCTASGFSSTGVAGQSGLFGPAGYFFIQVPTSGNPIMKVPFFNS